jgi:hypothetical protein
VSTAATSLLDPLHRPRTFPFLLLLPTILITRRIGTRRREHGGPRELVEQRLCEQHLLRTRRRVSTETVGGHLDEFVGGRERGMCRIVQVPFPAGTVRSFWPFYAGARCSLSPEKLKQMPLGATKIDCTSTASRPDNTALRASILPSTISTSSLLPP